MCQTADILLTTIPHYHHLSLPYTHPWGTRVVTSATSKARGQGTVVEGDTLRDYATDVPSGRNPFQAVNSPTL